MLRGQIRISNFILMWVFILVALIPGRVYAETEQLKPVINFNTDLYYNGMAQNLASISGQPDETELDPEKMTITYQGRRLDGVIYKETDEAPTNAGKYNVTVSYAGDDIYESVTETKRIDLNPMPLSYNGFKTEETIKKIYDGSSSQEQEEIPALKHEMVLPEDEDQVTFEFDSTRFYNKNVVSDNFLILTGMKISGDQGYNYTISTISDEDLKALNENLSDDEKIKNTDCLIAAEITKRPVGIYLTGSDKSYDGTSDLLSYGFSLETEDLVMGEEIAITTDAGFAPWYGEEGAKIKDVGEYRIFAQGGYTIEGLGETLGSNYCASREVICSHIMYEITPVEIVVEPTYRYKYQGDDDPLLTYSIWRVTTRDSLIDGLFGDDELYGSLVREKGELPGKYDIYQGDLNNGNYIIYFQNGADKFEILEGQEVVETIDGNDYYSGSGGEVGDWTEEITPTEAFSGFLLLLIVVVAGIFFIRNRINNFE
ncbi:YDG domain-containing protein [Eubacteriaceae bacterium ES3]|nr:YDG domain-containing protein [Eubacteriaceae bacterium ES3]